MSHKFESGDEFKIDPKYLGHRCNAKNKTYIIHHLSKSGNLVYYGETFHTELKINILKM